MYKLQTVTNQTYSTKWKLETIATDYTLFTLLQPAISANETMAELPLGT